MKKGGRIIHIGSIASYEAVGSGYNCSKSILLSYVRSLGRLLIKDKIILTGILPRFYWAQKRNVEIKKNITAYKKFIKTRLPAQNE